MTGFASVQQQTNAGELFLSLRSVNHRGLDLHFHLPSELAAFENAMRSVLKQNIGRGHVEIRARLSRDGESDSCGVNRDLLSRYLAAFKQLAKQHHLDSEPDLNMLFTLPGVLGSEGERTSLDSSFEAELMPALKACIEGLNGYREREGSELLHAFEGEASAIEQSTARINEIREEAREHFHNRLRERLSELLNGASISESRLAEEAALIADRSDVEEEITRLTVHTRELRRLLQDGGQIGKPIDFLLQEMNRETNTILAKTSGTGDAGLSITALGLAIKAHIEKTREQAVNIE